MSDTTRWPLSLEEPKLADAEISVWRAFLDCEPAVLRELELTLALEEKVRAQRFLFARDRDRFIAARGILRKLLGAYLQRDPKNLEFCYGPQGKPILASSGSIPEIYFNLSHSQGLAVYAFSNRREVGIDVESIKPDFASDNIAERFFSSREIEELNGLPPESRVEGFFLCWTRKEAYVKARGTGLQIRLDSFDVSLTPGRTERLESADSLRWSLCSFEPAPRYVGAVVGEGKGWSLLHRTWQP